MSDETERADESGAESGADEQASVEEVADEEAAREPEEGETETVEPEPGETEETETEGTEQEAGGGAQGGTGGRFALLTLVVLLVLALVGVGVLGQRALDVRAEADARREATRAAEKATGAILAFDYRHLDRDLKRASGYTTGKFAKDYEKTRKEAVRELAKKTKAVVKAEVMASSVVRASPDRVVCLLFVNQTTKSEVRDNRRLPDRNRVRMTMTKVDDRWLVSDLEAL